jgi:hypothetical protein
VRQRFCACCALSVVNSLPQPRVNSLPSCKASRVYCTQKCKSLTLQQSRTVIGCQRSISEFAFLSCVHGQVAVFVVLVSYIKLRSHTRIYNCMVELRPLYNTGIDSRPERDRTIEITAQAKTQLSQLRYCKTQSTIQMSRQISNAIAVAVLLLLVHEAVAAAGDLCKCRLVPDAKCLKTTETVPADPPAGMMFGSCIRKPCETWACDVAGTMTCIEKALKFILVFTTGARCTVRRPEGRTFLTPYTAHPEEHKPFLDKPKQFSFRFAANQAW